MKKNTKGFTLIELLAVIVILAIIALIATPIVLNLINEARKGAAKDSAYGVKKAAELYYSTSLLSDEGSFKGITFACDGKECTDKAGTTAKLNIEGTVPDTGSEITIAGDGKITYGDAGLIFGNYVVVLDGTTGKFKVS